MVGWLGGGWGGEGSVGRVGGGVEEVGCIGLKGRRRVLGLEFGSLRILCVGSRRSRWRCVWWRSSLW